MSQDSVKSFAEVEGTNQIPVWVFIKCRNVPIHILPTSYTSPRSHCDAKKDLWPCFNSYIKFYQCQTLKRWKKPFVKVALSHFSHWAVCVGPWQLLTLSGSLVWFLEHSCPWRALITLWVKEKALFGAENCFYIANRGRLQGILYAEWCQVQSPTKCPWARQQALSFSFIVHPCGSLWVA